jgi:hypothetical protein
LSLTARNAISAATLALFLFGLPLVENQLAQAQRKKKGKPACGITYLPLVEGNQWTYGPVQAPTPENEDQKKFLDGLAKLAPPHPKEVRITVVSVEKAGGGAEVTLEEITELYGEKNEKGEQLKGAEIKLETKLRCTAKSLEIDPNSFFFAAESGGGLLMELENVKRTGDPFPGKQGFRRGKKWSSEIKGDVTRHATEGTGATMTSGRVEMEREMTVGPTELLATPTGTYRADSVWFQMSGRAFVEPDIKTGSEMALGVPGTLWFEKKVGVVQAKNRSGQYFQLTSMKLN